MKRKAIDLGAFRHVAGEPPDALAEIRPQKKKSRDGKVQLSAYVMPEVRDRLKLIVIRRNMQSKNKIGGEDCLREAIDLFFDKYQHLEA